MGLLHRIRKLRGLNSEIDEELRFHLEEKERKLIADGLSPAAARREARKAFGSQAAVREHTRDAWIFRWADDLWRDLRFAARGLRKTPGFTSVAVLTLAIGIGANSTIFSFVNALLLRDLPVQNPEELLWFGADNEEGRWLNTLSFGFYEALAEERGAFAGVAAVGSFNAGLGERRDPIKIRVVTGDYFSVLQARTAVGRLISPDDLVDPEVRVLVLRYGLWRDRFGSDPSVVGSSVLLNGKQFTVVGVASPEFFGTNATNVADAWIPVTQTSMILNIPNWREMSGGLFQIFVRLSPGGSIEQAEAAAAIPYQRYLDALQIPQERRVRLKPVTAVSPVAREGHVERLRPLSIAVGLVLLICCANVGNLLLGRGVQRRYEFAVRLATGASRWRLTRRLLIEGLLLGFVGGAIGLAIAASSWRALRGAMPNAADLEASPDGAVLAFTLGASLLATLLFALMPAIGGSRVSLSSSLRGTNELSQGRIALGSRGWFVAAQVALCLPLLVCAGLLIQTVHNLFSQDVGFSRSQRIQASVSYIRDDFDFNGAPGAFTELLDNLREQAGVSDVGFSMLGVFRDIRLLKDLEIAGRNAAVQSSYAPVSEGYLPALGIPLLAGRDFRPTDDGAAPKVAIVSEAFANQFFGGVNPLGQRVSDLEIVGLAADAKDALREESQPMLYVPFRQTDGSLPAVRLYARTSMDLARYTAMVQELADRLPSLVKVNSVRTVDEQIESMMQDERMTANSLTLFGLVALVITAIGLYGVISFDVTRRTQEVGLRKALGAQTGDIFSMVFRRAAPWVLGGCLVGLAGAAAMTRLLEVKLFGVAALDPLTFALAAAFLLLCAAAANYLPARRAASVEPMTALRHE